MENESILSKLAYMHNQRLENNSVGKTVIQFMKFS